MSSSSRDDFDLTRKIRNILAEYDLNKGSLRKLAWTKESRPDVLAAIAELVKTAGGAAVNANEFESSLKKLIKKAFTTFTTHGKVRPWDYSAYSQTQIALIKLDFLLNAGANFKEWLMNHYIISKNNAATVLAQANLIQEVAKYYEINHLNLNERESNLGSMHANTPLHWAIMNNACDSAVCLTRVGLTIEIANVDSDGKNPLHMAILKGRKHVGDTGDKVARFVGSTLLLTMNDVVLALLQHKDLASFINAKMPDGNTPLHLAYMHKDLDLCNRLLELGALPDTKNDKGEIPAQMLSMSNADIEAYLYAHTGTSHTLSASKPPMR